MMRLVQTEIGPLEVTLHSPTSATVRTPSVTETATGADIPLPTTVNRVQVTFRADIGPSKVATEVPGKVWVEYLPTGPLHVKDLSIRKVDADWRWEPSWTMREKVEAIALVAVNSLLADPALTQQVAVDRASQDLARAQSAVEAAEKALNDALQARMGATNTLNALLSASPLAALDLALVRG